MNKVATYDSQRKTTTLHFPGDPHPPIEMYMRGGIAWPAPIAEQGGDIMGHIVMVGYDVVTGEYTVEDETEFLSVEHITGKDPHGCESIQHIGVCTFFNKMFKDFYGNSYYFHEHKETHKHYSREVLRSEMIKPKPSMIHTEWAEKSQIDRMILELMSLDKLVYAEGSPTHKALQMYEANMDFLSPPIKALHACIAGMVRNPWKEPTTEKIVYRWHER